MLDNPYLSHHKRFLSALLLGALAFALAARLPTESRLLVAGDTLFLAYLVLMVAIPPGADASGLRRRATIEDEGVVFIVALTVLAIVFSLASILTLLNSGRGPDRFGLVLAIVSVPLGWLTLHTMAAQHYANLYYAQAAGNGGREADEEESGAPRDRGGLDFPGGEAPDVFDFLYFSFVIGMTAQVSDVEISRAAIRRVVLAHSVASFFFNTVLVAVAVNAAVVGAN